MWSLAQKSPLKKKVMNNSTVFPAASSCISNVFRVHMRSTALLQFVLQFVHPKSRGRFAVVHQRKVFHPDAQLVSSLQRHQVSLRGRAHGPTFARVAVGLHHSLGLLVRIILPQHDLAGKGALGARCGESHSGVDVVVASLLYRQQSPVVAADTIQDWVLAVPLEVTGCKDPAGKLKV